jgi:flagellar hook-associated protein 3 FlgL
MLPPLKGTTQIYLADLNRVQTTMDVAQRQVSSGLRVGSASDDPGAVGTILQLQADISANRQTQGNFDQATSELNSADSGLQSAIQMMDRAVSLATQATGATKTAQERSAIAAEVGSLQELMVGIARSTVNGRYIFSGDQDTQPSYVVDAAQPNGVRQLTAVTSTRVIQDINGTSISVAKTAAEIFDARNPDGTAAAGNVFAALGNLLTALRNNDDAAMQTSAAGLKSASDHLNLQLAFYGQASTRVSQAQDLAKKFLVEQQSELSNTRDADLTTAAIQLSQATTQQQASLAAQSKISKLSLFDFLA